jgi:hypothetical protein
LAKNRRSPRLDRIRQGLVRALVLAVGVPRCDKRHMQGKACIQGERVRSVFSSLKALVKAANNGSVTEI